MRIIQLALAVCLASILPAQAQDNLYGHLFYPEATADRLTTACGQPSDKLHIEAAKPLAAMITAAAGAGVDLRPLSCFRSVSYQRQVFCRHVCDAGGSHCSGCRGRRESELERAKVSAPPGYSEHATGYALDFADGRNRKCDFEVCFGETKAGEWLLANGTDFGFELSFPEENEQGVSLEPWHWRFVGTPEAMTLFEQARRLYPASPASP